MFDGLTVIVLPVPTDVPPQDPLYHFQDAPLARLPPFMLKVVLEPLQTVVVPLMLITGREVSLTVMIMDLQAVLPQ